METNKKETALKNIENAIKKVQNKKETNMLFFVPDSKGTPIGTLSYIYGIALQLQEMGYNVKMLHGEKEFNGVGSWLGEKYANLTHYDTTKENVDISASDFLFVPDMMVSVLQKVKELPCKKILIFENFGYFVDTIPLGATLANYNIKDCITTSKTLEAKIKTYFPKINTFVVEPFIEDFFNKDEERKPNLIVNIISNDDRNINQIVKPFKWKSPIYNFVTFRYIHGRSHEEMAKYLKEGTVTIWIDTDTCFGYSAIESLACGNILIGKIPENIPDWMVDGNNDVKDCGIWFYNNDELPKILASVIQTVLYNKVPQVIFDNADKVVDKYRINNTERVNNFNSFVNDWIIKSRVEDLNKIKEEIEKEEEENEENNAQ